MNTFPPIHDITTSLICDRVDDQPDIPDGFIDLSDAITPLRQLTFNGRALRSADPYSIGQMLGRLVDAYLPDNPTSQDLERCIFGLLVLNAQLMRSIPDQHPDMSLEEYLLEAVHQDTIKYLSETFTTTPVNSHISPTGVDVAQHSLFREAIPLTDEAIEGFIARQILPYEEDNDVDDLFNVELLEGDQPLLTRVDVLPPNVEIDDLPAFSHEGFDEFYDAYFSRKFDDEPDDDLT